MRPIHNLAKASISFDHCHAKSLPTSDYKEGWDRPFGEFSISTMNKFVNPCHDQDVIMCDLMQVPSYKSVLQGLNAHQQKTQRDNKQNPTLSPFHHLSVGQ